MSIQLLDGSGTIVDVPDIIIDIKVSKLTINFSYSYVVSST